MFFKKKEKLQESKEKLQNGQLPFGWVSRHRTELDVWEKKLPDLASKTKTGSVEEKINALEQLISFYQDFKSFCYQDECFQKYFQDMWEHCHNSQNPDFEYIQPYVEELTRYKKGQ